MVRALDGKGGVSCDIQIGVYNRQFEDRLTYKAGMIDSTLAKLFGGEEMVKQQREMRKKLNNIDNEHFDHDKDRVAARKVLQKEYVESLITGKKPSK